MERTPLRNKVKERTFDCVLFYLFINVSNSEITLITNIISLSFCSLSFAQKFFFEAANIFKRAQLKRALFV